MLKKALLTTLLTLSTIAVADINLDLDLTIVNEGTEYNTHGSLVVKENITTSLALDDANTLIINMTVTQENEDVIIQTQLFEKVDSDTDEFEVISEPVIKVAFNKTGTISLGNDDNNSLTLSITPTLVE